MYHCARQFSPMTIGARIRAARRARGWSQQQLADAVGAVQTTVSSWERGRTEPGRDDTVRIASKLGIPLEDIEQALRPDRPKLIRELPVLSWVSAGAVNEVGSLDAVSADEHIAISGLGPGDYFITRVVGDSMDRISPEGSHIIVNVSDQRLIQGKAYIFSLRGETTYKLYQGSPVRRLEPFSTNPANKTIFLMDNGWSVVGRVVRSFIDLT